MSDDARVTMDDGRLERTLRLALTADRPVAGAPESLRAAVESIPSRTPVGIRGWFGRRQTVIVALAAMASVVALVVLYGHLVPRLAGETGGPTAGAAPDLSIEGQGIISSALPTLPIVTLGAAAVFGAFGLRLARRWSSERRPPQLVGVVLLVAGAVGVAAVNLEPGFSCACGYGPALGLNITVEAPPGSDQPTTYYITATAGQPFAFVVMLMNEGPLPIRLDGIVQDANLVDRQPGQLEVPHWSSIWLESDPNAMSADQSGLIPFAPATVDPNGGTLVLYVVGKAGACAFGPTYGVGVAGGNAYEALDRNVRLAYSVLGLQTSGSFTLPLSIIEPTAATCP